MSTLSRLLDDGGLIGACREIDALTRENEKLRAEQVKEDIPELTCAYGTRTYPANVNRELMGRPKAFALYQALRDWIRVYEGEKTLERLDQETESETSK